jgi:hydrogenase maturation protein HypF
MQSYHIHIKGIVQGVGFRPFVYRLAHAMNINGWVSNTQDGVHIEITAIPETANAFYLGILRKPPANALITDHHMIDIPLKDHQGFSIVQRSYDHEPDLLLTPDIALCESCKKEIHDPNNRRYRYAFTTCLECGPRYSITKALPYDRENTTMQHIHTCEQCNKEYNDVDNRRNFSQTNSCPNCAVHLTLHGENIPDDEIPARAAALIAEGKILAVKGIGGYLLLCDATNDDAIRLLRKRKQRPSKPFALLYPSIEAIKNDVAIRPIEEKALRSKYAPIVLCNTKKTPGSSVAYELIAPGLQKLGVMLPYSPLLELIAHEAARPLVATSANLSGSPIIYKDDEALKELSSIADHIITYDREIVGPQDDSVIQYNTVEQLIILRRGRGLAPNYISNPFAGNISLLAMGAALKGAFCIQHKKNLYVSQYLGNQEMLESQQSYKETLDHFHQLFHIKPKAIIIDKHPNYHVSEYGIQIQKVSGAKLIEVQHHEAHFGAVLAENRLIHKDEPIMGFIWDGTGYGNDGQIWGGETFIYDKGTIERVAHLKYFPQLLGDKMSREPRLSALSLLSQLHEFHYQISKYFTPNEWSLYHRLMHQENKLKTSSMGRFLDGVACILGLATHNSYEGEAAMQLEALALSEKHKTNYRYTLPLVDGVLDWDIFMEQLMTDERLGRSRGWIALKVFNTLVDVIEETSEHHHIKSLAFSGGVFQNAHLTSLITERFKGSKQVYFHKQLSPNDECIGFGQIACAYIAQQQEHYMANKNESHVLSNTR